MKLSFWILFITLTLSACGGSSNKDKSPNNPAEISSSSSSTPTIRYIYPFSGNNQLSQPNTILPLEPMAKVSDQSDQPIAGVKVSFSITTGNGEIQNSSAITDSKGIASAGKWNPGSNIGVNTLSATVDGLPPAVFNALTARSSPDIKLNSSAGRVLSYQNLGTYVISTYKIDKVSASINGMPIGIKLSDFPNSWRTLFSELKDIPSGPIVYVVTVTDAVGNTADIVSLTILDRPPTTSISTIEEGSVLQSLSLELSATCADDLDICRSILVDLGEYRQDSMSTKFSRNFIDKYISTIHEFIDVSELSGVHAKIAVTGTDTYGSFGARTYRSFYIEPSPHLSPFAKASDRILDISNNHILFVDTPSQTNVPTLKILDVLTGTEQIITEDKGLNSLNYGHARITPTGAIFAFDPWENTSSEKFIYEWKENNISTLSKMASIAFSENANWLVYFDGDSLWRRNISDGVSVVIPDAANTTDHSISSQGDIAWSLSSNIYSLRANTDEPELVSSGYLPSTNGTNIVYRKDGRQIAIHDGAQETILATQSNDFPKYVMAGDYVAYMKDSQVWLYHNGSTQQITVFGNASSVNLEAIAQDGTISFTYNNKRYVKKPDAELKEIGSGLGKPFFSGNKLFIIIGYTVLEATL